MYAVQAGKAVLIPAYAAANRQPRWFTGAKHINETMGYQRPDARGCLQPSSPSGLFLRSRSLSSRCRCILRSFSLSCWRLCSWDQKRAFASVITYLVIGLCGLPIFATGGGPAYLLKPTFGFLIGFAAATFVTGRVYEIRKSTSFFWLLFSAFWGTSRGLCLRNDLFLCVQQFCPRRECRLEACVYQLFPP